MTLTREFTTNSNRYLHAVGSAVAESVSFSSSSAIECVAETVRFSSGSVLECVAESVSFSPKSALEPSKTLRFPLLQRTPTRDRRDWAFDPHRAHG
jgi:hypothetical protein